MSDDDSGFMAELRELRAEVETLRRELALEERQHAMTREAFASAVRANLAAEAQAHTLREALRGLLSRPFAKPGWSPEWDALMDKARAALALPPGDAKGDKE